MRKHPILVLGALGVLGLANPMLAQDLAAFNVALPSIERDLDVDLTLERAAVDAHLAAAGTGLPAPEWGALDGVLAGPTPFRQIVAVGVLVSLLLLRGARRERGAATPLVPCGTR